VTVDFFNVVFFSDPQLLLHCISTTRFECGALLVLVFELRQKVVVETMPILIIITACRLLENKIRKVQVSNKLRAVECSQLRQY